MIYRNINLRQCLTQAMDKDFNCITYDSRNTA